MSWDLVEGDREERQKKGGRLSLCDFSKMEGTRRSMERLGVRACPLHADAQAWDRPEAQRKYIGHTLSIK